MTGRKKVYVSSEIFVTAASFDKDSLEDCSITLSAMGVRWLGEKTADHAAGKLYVYSGVASLDSRKNVTFPAVSSVVKVDIEGWDTGDIRAFAATLRSGSSDDIGPFVASVVDGKTLLKWTFVYQSSDGSRDIWSAAPNSGEGR